MPLERRGPFYQQDRHNPIMHAFGCVEIKNLGRYLCRKTLDELVKPATFPRRSGKKQRTGALIRLILAVLLAPAVAPGGELDTFTTR
jgi:hypothetical protein